MKWYWIGKKYRVMYLLGLISLHIWDYDLLNLKNIINNIIFIFSNGLNWFNNRSVSQDCGGCWIRTAILKQLHIIIYLYKRLLRLYHCFPLIWVIFSQVSHHDKTVRGSSKVTTLFTNLEWSYKTCCHSFYCVYVLKYWTH